MSDLLNMELINSLPQPLWVSENGKDWWWPVIEIDVQTGLMRIDVCGQQQRCHFDDYSYVRDDAQVIHSWETFYLDDVERDNPAFMEGDWAIDPRGRLVEQ